MEKYLRCGILFYLSLVFGATVVLAGEPITFRGEVKAVRLEDNLSVIVDGELTLDPRTSIGTGGQKKWYSWTGVLTARKWRIRIDPTQSKDGKEHWLSDIDAIIQMTGRRIHCLMVDPLVTHQKFGEVVNVTVETLTIERFD